jgi:hypothetical protein
VSAFWAVVALLGVAGIFCLGGFVGAVTADRGIPVQDVVSAGCGQYNGFTGRFEWKVPGR